MPATFTNRRPTNVTVAINWSIDDRGEEVRDGWV